MKVPLRQGEGGGPPGGVGGSLREKELKSPRLSLRPEVGSSPLIGLEGSQWKSELSISASWRRWAGSSPVGGQGRSRRDSESNISTSLRRGVGGGARGGVGGSDFDSSLCALRRGVGGGPLGGVGGSDRERELMPEGITNGCGLYIIDRVSGDGENKPKGISSAFSGVIAPRTGAEKKVIGSRSGIAKSV